MMLNKKTYDIFCRQNRTVQCVQVGDFLKKHGWELKQSNPEVVIIIGGDGSFLDAFHFYKNKGKDPYFLFLNAGYLGFFSIDIIENFKKVLNKLCSNELGVEYIDALHIKNKNKSFYAINELKVMSLMKASTWAIKIQSDKNSFYETISATGLVFSTTLGSNGLARTLGSAIIIPTLRIIQYSKIAPVYNKTTTPITASIIAEKNVIITINKKTPYETHSYVDNNVKVGSNINEHIIELKENVVKLIVYRNQNFFFKKMKTAYNF